MLMDCLALGAIFSGLIVISSQSPVLSVLYLISLFISIAGFLVIFGLGFLGLSYIIVYVGAVAILFLFVVIILDLQLDELSAEGVEYTQNMPLGGILVAMSIWLANSVLSPMYKDLDVILGGPTSLADLYQYSIIGLVSWSNFAYITEVGYTIKGNIIMAFSNGSPDMEISTYLDVQSIGNILYTNAALWLLIAGILLLLSIVGPISLNKGKTM